MDHLRIQADFVVASETQVLHPGQVVVSRGQVMHVTGSTRDRPDLDLTDSVLLPGLINAHTHLEFSDLPQPFPAGPDFPSWISSVITHRRDSVAQLTNEQVVESRRAAILSGIIESAMSGTCVLGDIVTYPWQPGDLPTRASLSDRIQQRPRTLDVPHIEFDMESWRNHVSPSCVPFIMAFAELIGLTEERFQMIAGWVRALFKQDVPAVTPLSQLGISPHAPYSVPILPVEQLLKNIPSSTTMAMHLAESREELELLAHGTGPFRERFDTMGIPTPSSYPTIEDCIRLLGRRQRSLLVHGNYLTRSQIALAAANKSIACVYCPRTHRHFGHEPYPLALMHQHGLPVVLGTDSRASNPDLNLWSEIVTARHIHPDLSPEQALAAVTTGAARALGLQQAFGSLTTGKVAAMNVVPRQAHWNSANLLDEMTSSPLTCEPLARF